MKTTTVEAYGTKAADAPIHDSNLKSAGILPTDSVEKASYGNFVHLMDPEGYKLNYRNLMMWKMPSR
ncbi:hypothetical protein ACCC92_25060 [Mucilaginibacter sp. Mucisp84]|uniref:hypothetical protein n=1 Tax=Mucilaginibacter sp. Mucisp84 TaxID=3243058 RepID=UPI0039A4FEF5